MRRLSKEVRKRDMYERSMGYGNNGKYRLYRVMMEGDGSEMRRQLDYAHALMSGIHVR